MPGTPVSQDARVIQLREGATIRVGRDPHGRINLAIELRPPPELAEAEGLDPERDRIGIGTVLTMGEASHVASALRELERLALGDRLANGRRPSGG